MTRAGEAYGITVAVMAPEAFTTGEIDVTINDPQGELVHKTLHPQDLDLYATVRPRRAGEIVVRGKGAPEAAKVKVEFSPLSIANPRRVAAQPNGDWKSAQEIELGETVFGSNDERPYVPASPDRAYAALVSGFQWFRFTSPKPQLVYFVLETPDRDVPPDVDIFELKDGALSPYAEGASAYTPEATQNFPGLSPVPNAHGSSPPLLFRVAANHPFYRLRTDCMRSAIRRSAVRAGMDFLVNLGDAWHANTPRRGAVALRNTMTHAEPQSCIACHPTQFTTRGYLTAVKNGYPNTRRNSLSTFLLTRLENNPRPLYGQPDTNWARVIYSARTVPAAFPCFSISPDAPIPASRRATPTTSTLAGGSRSEEPDGCQPMVSASEIDLQAWQTYGLMVRDFPTEAQWKTLQVESRHTHCRARPHQRHRPGMETRRLRSSAYSPLRR